MRTVFVHTADNHLGYEQYGVRERYDDFARAFLAVVEGAITRQADFFVIAGDLFNKRAIDARTLTQANEGLRLLADAGIVAIGIEGNHDRSYYRDGMSWLQYLSYQGLLRLLSPTLRDGAPVMAEWSPESLLGLYTTLKGGRARVYGLPWYGSSTARVMASFAETLAAAREREEAEGVEYRVLLMHTGVEGVLPKLQGLPTRADFEPLRELVDFIALGHVHKPYEIDGWLYNPGSTETWGAEESEWSDRGYYAVTVDTDVTPGEPRHFAERITNPRRPFVRLSFRVDGLSDPTSFYERFERMVAQGARAHQDAVGRKPVVDVSMIGVYAFDSSAIERARLEKIITERFQPLVARIHDSARANDWDVDSDTDDSAHPDRAALELRVLEDLVARDARYTAQAPAWAATLAQLKRMALEGEDPEQITTVLRVARARLG
ncbi:MAG TPA: exonuclease SbcCD subunit D [Ktedonobacterales bacterium]